MSLDEYVLKRNAVLLQDNKETFHDFCLEYGIRFSNPVSEEIARHKLITASIALPTEFRMRSDIWLKNRGYESWA